MVPFQNPHTPCGKSRTPLSTASALTLPRLSCTFNLTVMANHVTPAGNGGDGTMLQSTTGIVSTGPAVVCANVFATPNDQSQAVIVPGAVDVAPLNVQSSVLPLFVSVHVSVSVGPLTPKLAVAWVARVTESIAEAEVPP